MIREPKTADQKPYTSNPEITPEAMQAVQKIRRRDVSTVTEHQDFCVWRYVIESSQDILIFLAAVNGLSGIDYP